MMNDCRRLWWVSLFAVLVLGAAGCGIGNGAEESDPLPDVEALDDEAATPQGQLVEVLVLANDLTDDTFILDWSQAVNEFSVEQPLSVFLGFSGSEDSLEYTPPDGFLGVVTFTYEIIGLGISYDWESEATGTVTVTVTDTMPPVVAVEDIADTESEVPVTVDVLLNDTQDAGTIASFTDAMDEGGLEQAGSVEIVAGAPEELMYSPPAGFSGEATFEYTIVGAGVSTEAGSEDTAVVTVRVEDPGPSPTTASIVFRDCVGEDIEGLFFFVGQAAIDSQIQTGGIFQAGATTGIVEVDPGVDVPIRAVRFFEPPPTTVDASCVELAAGMDYTIFIAPDGPIALECVEGFVGCP